MGIIPARTRSVRPFNAKFIDLIIPLQPTARFTFPTFGTTVKTNAPFTVSLAVANFATGNFASSSTKYLAAPQQVDDAGMIKGYSAIVIEKMISMTDIDPPSPSIFTFFKGLNTPAVGQQLTANVTGLPAGVYRLSSLLRAANHQPVITAFVQHGAIDDVIYVSLIISSLK